MRLRQPAAHRDSRAHAVDGELARMRALLSPEQNERLDRTLQAVLDGGRIDQNALRDLIAEGVRNTDILRPERRTARADLEQSWRDVEDTIQEISRKRPWSVVGDF
jgi:hypothetical protein